MCGQGLTIGETEEAGREDVPDGPLEEDAPYDTDLAYHRARAPAMRNGDASAGGQRKFGACSLACNGGLANPRTPAFDALACRCSGITAKGGSNGRQRI
ncbi:hypothetical protein GCM10027612_22760 [Microbispora bryophytorum subsp. camponoti]